MDSSISEQDSIAQRWLAALLQFDSTLPRPVAHAMIQNVARGPLGDSLRQLEGGLIKLEGIHPEEITGSEARTVLAILLQMDHRVTQLHSQIRQLWNAPADRGHPFDTFGRAGSSAPSAALGE